MDYYGIRKVDNYEYCVEHGRRKEIIKNSESVSLSNDV